MVHGGQWFLDNVIPKIISTGLPINTTYLGRGASSHFQSNADEPHNRRGSICTALSYKFRSWYCSFVLESGTRFRFWNMEFPIYLLFPLHWGKRSNLKDRRLFLCDNQKTFFLL